MLVVWHWNGGFGYEIGVETGLAVGLRSQRHPHHQNWWVGVQPLPLQASPGEAGILCALLLSRLTSCGSVAASTADETEEMGSASGLGKWAHPFVVGLELVTLGRSSA